MVPVIDLKRSFNDNKERFSDIINEIHNASIEYGFFYITGHNIAASNIFNILELSKIFFSLPDEQKEYISVEKSLHVRGYGKVDSEQLDPCKRHDHKESFDMGLDLPQTHPDVISGKPLRGKNIHPDIVGWRDAFESHFKDMHQLSIHLLSLFSLALGLQKNYFESLFTEPLSKFRVLHYPPISYTQDEDKEKVVAGSHTDYGLITILWQDKIGGLQIRNNHRWIDVPFIEDSFVVNIGDMFVHYTNGLYKSATHRVVGNNINHRYSLPFFVEPNPESIIDCLPGVYGEKKPCNRIPIKAVDYLQSRFYETYDYRRSHKVEVQQH